MYSQKLEITEAEAKKYRLSSINSSFSLKDLLGFINDHVCTDIEFCFDYYTE